MAAKRGESGVRREVDKSAVSQYLLSTRSPLLFVELRERQRACSREMVVGSCVEPFEAGRGQACAFWCADEARAHLVESSWPAGE